MSDLKELTGSIIGQAKAEAEELSRQAAAESERILKEARQQADAISARVAGEVQQKIETLERRYQIEAELEGRKQLLAAKHRLIERVFGEALMAMKKLPADKRMSFLARRLAEAGAVQGGEVEGVGSNSEWLKIIREANELLARSGKLAQLVLSIETPNLEGGFLLNGPGFTVDGSYEAMLSEIKDVMVPEIAQYLFESEKR